MPEKFLNLNEAAEILRISEDALTNLVNEGKITAYKIAGEYLRFDKEQIEKYKGTVMPASTPTSKARPKENNLGLGDSISDFLYFNDFYIVSSLIIIVILTIIFFK